MYVANMSMGKSYIKASKCRSLVYDTSTLYDVIHSITDTFRTKACPKGRET